MGISLLTTAQVKSHLQKYRIRVVAEGKASDAATEAQARVQGEGRWETRARRAGCLLPRLYSRPCAARCCSPAAM